MKKYLGLAAVIFSLLLAGIVSGSVPGKISYEGRLTDASGNPITTAKTVDFAIFDAATAGTAVWGPESISVTPDSQGVFSVTLGNIIPLTSTVFSTDTRYLQITVGGEILSPRTQLVSVGYSFKSAVAQGVEDGSITRAKAASGQFVKSIIAGSGIGVTGDEGSGTGQVTLTASGTGGGTVSQIDTGTGLTGGPITTTGTISLVSPVTAVTGGTGQTTYTTGDILYSDAANSLAKLPVGTAGQVLKVTGGVPVWSTAGGTGTVTQVDSGTGLTGGPITGTGTIAVDSTVVTLTGTQTVINKTLTSPTINTATISGGTIDNAAIGGSTKAAGSFTTLASTGQYTNTVAGGTAPMVITSNTLVTNLNADQVQGHKFLPNTVTWTATASNTRAITDANVTASSIILANWGNTTTAQSRTITKIVPTAGSFTLTFSGNLSAGSTTLNYLVIN